MKKEKKALRTLPLSQTCAEFEKEREAERNTIYIARSMHALNGEICEKIEAAREAERIRPVCERLLGAMFGKAGKAV